MKKYFVLLALLFLNGILWAQNTTKVFPKKADFNVSTFSKPAVFSLATFSKPAVFSLATFLDTADFHGAKFLDTANFFYAKFPKGANFSAATFSNEANFSAATFSKGADFHDAKFSKRADFSDEKFLETAEFKGTTFSKRVNFYAAKFSKRADFYLAKFLDTANFERSKFSEMANFDNTPFSKTADFSLAEFSKTADFSFAIFSERTDFSDAKFLDTANFEGAEFSKMAYLGGTTFLKRADFYGAKFSKMASFSSVLFSAKSTLSLSHLSVADSTHFQFYNALLPDTILFADNIEIKNVIDFTTADFNNSAIFNRNRKSGKPILIYLVNSDIGKLHLDYVHFKLLFPDSTKNTPFDKKRISNDQKASVYESLLNNFKTSGQTESFQLLDIEYQEFKWHNSRARFLAWIPKYWWNFGYDKEYIFVWTVAFLVLFTSFSYFFIHSLNTKIYKIENIPVNDLWAKK